MLVRGSVFTGPHSIIKLFIVAVLLTIPTCDCKRDCSQHDYYQELERALVSDAENIFKLQKLFFPTIEDPYDKLVLNVCVAIFNDQMSSENSSLLTEKYWIFEYSTTLLTGLITPAELYAFDSITTIFLVETAVHFQTNSPGHGNLINLQATFACTVYNHDSELYKCLARLTSWVRYTVHCTLYTCSF